MAEIGAHVSVAGGLYKGIEKAQLIGAKAIQIFGSSPRQWSYTEPDQSSIKVFREALSKSNVQSVFLHASYLINLAALSEEHWSKSILNLSGHFKIARSIGAQGLIFHVGTFNSEGRESSLDRAATAMREVLSSITGKTWLIMENAAGGKSKIGSRLEDLADLKKRVRSNRVKICLDTAHALESGLIESYTRKNISHFLDDFEKLIGLRHLVVLHVNDSKTPFNSHHDRHENIGEGHIGIEGFMNLAKEKRINKQPWILEVPGFLNKGPDKKNVKILNDCFHS